MRQLIHLIFIILAASILLSCTNEEPSQNRPKDGCEGGLPPRLTVGEFAKVLHPDKIQTYNEETPNWLTEKEELVIFEGPRCIEKRYYWKVERPTHDNSAATARPNDIVWINESIDNEYVLEPGSGRPEVGTVFSPPVVNLWPETSAPIVNAQKQILFLGSGGGPSGGYQEDYATAYFGEDWTGDYDLQINTIVNILQPDGNLYKTTTVLKESLTVDMWSENGWFKITRPTHPGLMQGIWVVEIISPNETYSEAYELKAAPFPHIWAYCDGFERKILLTGFEPNQEVELILGDQAQDTFDVYHWPLQVDQTGSLIASLRFPILLGSNELVVLENDREWPIFENEYGRSWLQDSFNLALNFFSDCSKHLSEIEAQQNLLKYGAIVPGRLLHYLDELKIDREFYAFEGQSGDIVNIKIATFIDAASNPDLAVELKGPDGTVLVENDDADNPKYSSLDPEIDRFQLPLDGIYTIVVKQADNNGGYYTLLLEKR